VLRWDLTITTGLSAKNLIIYLLAVIVGLRMVIARTSVIAAPGLQAAWLVQIGYAMCTWLVAALIIKYPGYDLLASGILLKSGLVDYYIFFLVFLFGVESAEDAMKVIKWMLAGAVFAHLMTIFDTAGLVNLGYKERIDGRTQGALGESNQYAAYIVLFIPGLIAAAVASRGVRRLAWLGGVLLSCVALAMTASRGAIAGGILACVVGAYLYRHLVSYSRVAGWVFASLVLLVIILSFSQYGGLLTERVFGQTASSDAFDASSGRSQIWFDLFEAMVANPVTFITGYGWVVYWSMPFHFAPHNHYFALWFNLGLVGLVSGCYLLFSAIGRARRASLIADPESRRQLIAFVVGGTAVCGAVFFVDLHDPWTYFWMYSGATMRLALCMAPQAAQQSAPLPGSKHRLRLRGPQRPRDAYGWAGAQGRRS
jgi:hypothetical protein